ncbi:uncharacterized protein LOC116264205 [Nymphaea colorata]|nr:uncharacterized protein LOC116264205 [Nymphaea colorata]
MADEDAAHHQTEVKTEDIQNFDDSDVSARMEKYSKYKAEYARRIKAKYFSKKSPNGVNVFEKETSIDDELIKSSRWPCTKYFIECINNVEDISKLSGVVADAAASTPPRKASSKK